MKNIIICLIVQMSERISFAQTSLSLEIIGAEKLIRAFRERCLPGILRNLRLVLSYFNHVMEKCKSPDGFSLQKFYGLHDGHLDPDVLSLVVK